MLQGDGAFVGEGFVTTAMSVNWSFRNLGESVAGFHR